MLPAIVSPGLILVVGGLLVCLLPKRLRPFWTIGLPILTLAQLWSIPQGTFGQFAMFGLELTFVRIDALSRVFGTIFCLAAAINAVYALTFKNVVEDAAGLVYAGAAVGATFAGDLLTLFCWWELTAISSAVVIWSAGTADARAAGMRYLLIQLISGLLLLAGAAVMAQASNDVAFDRMALAGLGPTLVFLAFGIKCAFPLLHNWLQDAYPEASPSGTVWLSAFSTKLAVYALARGFAGTEILIPIGAAMTAFPIFFAVIENDLRRVLAYSLNNQLGFMVVGIGIGTPLALNGVAAHAFCHIVYKSLLFTSMGAVLYRVGTVKASQLGGLYKSMPWTTFFCIVGGLSISSVPLFSGFVSKSMIVSATAEAHLTWIWLVLIFASAGVLHHSGIKIPFFAFFAHDSGLRPQEAPKPMLIAMALNALLCVGIGLAPQLLYAILPYPVDYRPYTAAHVVYQMQLVLFSMVAFGWLMRNGLYPPETMAINLDTDWLYRKFAPRLLRPVLQGLASTRDRAVAFALDTGARVIDGPMRRAFGANSVLGGTPLLGNSVIWIALTLAMVLLIYFAHNR